MLILFTLGTLFFVVQDYGLVVSAVSKVPASDNAAPDRLPAYGKVIQTGPKAYSVHMVGHVWAWAPSALHVPQGAAVTFYVTSADVLHGFEVQGTPINVTAVPGMTGKVTYTFRRPGIYHTICNEYCGLEHQAMTGVIIVEPEVSS
jgi:cytochrome c oxidase subunit 2